MINQRPVNKRFKDLTNDRQKTYRLITARIRSLTRVLKNRNDRGKFPARGITRLGNTFDIILVKTGESSGEHFRRTITGIPSGPVAFDGSSPAITAATFLVVISKLSRCMLVICGKSGRGCPESSRVELVLNSFANSSALSLEDVRTLGP